MASHFELDSFLRKFVNLWQSGYDAKLNIESEGGRVFVNLRVGLEDGHLGDHGHVVRHRGGGPAQQRRRSRREAERQEASAAGKVVENAQETDSKDVVVETQVKLEVTEEVTKKKVVEVQQEDKISEDNKAHFEVIVEAHEKCNNNDVIEAIQENFFGALDEKNVDKVDPVRHLIINQERLEDLKVRNKYKIIVRENEIATNILGLWNKPYEFDDSAFKNAVHGDMRIKIKEVKRVR